MNNNSLSLRSGTLKDLNIMALISERALAQREGRELPERVSKDSVDRKSIQDELENRGSWSYLLFVNDILMGFALGHALNDEEHEREQLGGNQASYVRYLMVEPLCWGEGTGSTLLHQVEDGEKLKGTDLILLWTQENNDRAQRLYERNGYKATGATQVSERFGKMLGYKLELQ